MQTPSRVLEITVISAEGLLINCRPINKKNTLVTVRSDPHNHRSTRINSEDGSYPSWNEKLDLELPNHAQSITAQVYCQTLLGNIMVGMANIPISDFIGDYTPARYLHFLSYRLRDSKGNPNGIINLSVRVKVPWEKEPDGVGAGVPAW